MAQNVPANKGHQDQRDVIHRVLIIYRNLWSQVGLAHFITY